MSELALPITELAECTAAPRKRISPIALEILILGGILTVLQIADGCLTAIGVSYYGTAIEGNFVLRSLMESYGVIATLVGVKILAVCIILGLCQLAFTVAWLRSALKAIISLYIFAAVLPWSYILLGSLN